MPNPPPMLGSAGAVRDNNLNLIRFLAASAVIFSHSYPLSGFIDQEPVARFVGVADLATIAVIIFFVISGYLVTQSIVRARSVRYYVASRFLRIFPALVLATLVSVVVIGPMATNRPALEYFTAAGTWSYLYHNLVLETGHTLPGVFSTNPVANGVNGSLWTVRIEVVLYGIVLAAWLARIYGSRIVANAFLATCVLFWLAAPQAAFALLPANDAYMTPWLIGSFMWGVFFYVNRSSVPLSGWIAAALLVLVYSVAGNITWFYYTLYFTLAYITIVFAFHPLLQLPSFNKVGDYSYGLYVFAFPIQQLIVEKFAPIRPLPLFLVSYLATLLVAILSWRFVEQPALRLKRLISTDARRLLLQGRSTTIDSGSVSGMRRTQD